MRSLKLGVIAAITALALIGVFRVADIVTAQQAPWLAKRALAAIALLMVAGLALGAVSRRSSADDAGSRPIP